MEIQRFASLETSHRELVRHLQLSHRQGVRALEAKYRWISLFRLINRTCSVGILFCHVEEPDYWFHSAPNRGIGDSTTS